ncbi:PTS fructose transporter subunit IIABC [Mediannikoviicoccus vaginalis]|uniref:PTS fructose transporter subunit IIABC n=1 Tax=Mediannikoviicoccus vaginalis TaxID=2899727 RepID=UPI001F0207F0|nr:fructose-specific PTS transporter subunit EIIC [Mediannikoviicoccus vaginalis]
MKITDLLTKDSISIGESLNSKNEAIDKAVGLMNNLNNIEDLEEFKRKVYLREEQGSTGVGEGVAIPHGKSNAVSKPGLAAITIPDGVEFDSLDGNPVNLLFLIAAPDTDSNVHLQILARLSKMLMDKNFISSLVKAKSKEEFLEIIDNAEKEKFEEEAAVSQEVSKETKNIVAVTGCPTGIAHTYMAAEALEKKARELGYNIKVETRGSGGAKNVLTDEDIANADGIIIASDTNVPMDRFAGKKVIETQVSDGISKPDVLIERVLSENAPIYKAKGGSSVKENKVENESTGHKIYRHLMNGVSHMLPFVVGGGILIALSFLVDSLSVDLGALTVEQRSNLGTITETAKTLKTIGGLSFSFMLPVLAGFIAMSIADRPGLVAGFVGGAIAAAGTSGFLGALAAGFLAGYIVKGLMKITNPLPKNLDGIRTILIYPVFGVLFTGLVMTLAIEPVVGKINVGLNTWLSSLQGTSSLVLGFIVAGMMAVDMGGPFNKASYVFGTASIAAGNYNIMAAVMIGGMVPPIAIALASLIFKNKFTETQRKSAPANIIMGLSFITEGAIPFAAQDPARVLPSCIIGSGVAGALSMLFNCTLMAPHGGIFVVPVIGNPLMYLLALAVGTAISTILLGVLKKNIK